MPELPPVTIETLLLSLIQSTAGLRLLPTNLAGRILGSTLNITLRETCWLVPIAERFDSRRGMLRFTLLPPIIRTPVSSDSDKTTHAESPHEELGAS